MMASMRNDHLTESAGNPCHSGTTPLAPHATSARPLVLSTRRKSLPSLKPSGKGAAAAVGLYKSAVQSSRNELRDLMNAPVIDWDAVRTAQQVHYQNRSLSNSSRMNVAGAQEEEDQQPSANATWDSFGSPPASEDKSAATAMAVSASFANILKSQTLSSSSSSTSTKSHSLTLKRSSAPGNSTDDASSRTRTLKKSRSDHWVTYKGYEDLIRSRSRERLLRNSASFHNGKPNVSVSKTASSRGLLFSKPQQQPSSSVTATSAGGGAAAGLVFTKQQLSLMAARTTTATTTSSSSNSPK